MTLNIFVKGKVDFRHVQIWLWICLSKEKLTLNISKYYFEYVCQKKSWFYTCPNMTLSMFVKGKLEFRHVEIWIWVSLTMENLNLDMSKYDFEYVCQRKSWL
jgi:predicted nucleic acid-binding Zn finger protein